MLVHTDSMRVLKAAGTQVNLLNQMTPRTELYDLLCYQDYEQMDATLAHQYSSL